MSTIKKHCKNLTWEEGSENVFADLDMPNAEEKLAKVKLAFKINEIIEKKHLTQAKAAELFGLDQSKISLIHCGHLKDFSIERLAQLLTLLNQDVDIVIRKSRRTSGHGMLRVMYT